MVYHMFIIIGPTTLHPLIIINVRELPIEIKDDSKLRCKCRGCGGMSWGGPWME